MNTTIHTIIDNHRIAVEVSAAEVMYLANQIEESLREQTQNIVVFAADAYNWCNGRNEPSIGIRRAKMAGNEIDTTVGDLQYLVAGTLRRIDNDQEIVRLRDLMAIGYNNAYVELRGQALCLCTWSTPKLGKRKIVDMQMIGDRAYLALAPID